MPTMNWGGSSRTRPQGPQVRADGAVYCGGCAQWRAPGDYDMVRKRAGGKLYRRTRCKCCRRAYQNKRYSPSERRRKYADQKRAEGLPEPKPFRPRRIKQ